MTNNPEGYPHPEGSDPGQLDLIVGNYKREWLRILGCIGWTENDVSKLPIDPDLRKHPPAFWIMDVLLEWMEATELNAPEIESIEYAIMQACSEFDVDKMKDSLNFIKKQVTRIYAAKSRNSSTERGVTVTADGVVVKRARELNSEV